MVAVLHQKKRLSFSGLTKALSDRWDRIEDHRSGAVRYSLHDCLMSGLATMFFQDPSLPAFRRRLEEASNLNHLKSLFKVEAIPCDTQLRDNLDRIESDSLEAVFSDFFRDLQRGKHLEGYQILGGRYLIVLDGSEYFSSKNQGYHLEHNFGHGHKNLSYNFFRLNLPAFFSTGLVNSPVLFTSNAGPNSAPATNTGINCDAPSASSW